MTNNPDPVRTLLAGAKADKEELDQWVADRTGELVYDLMEVEGVAVEDIPRMLNEFASWLRANPHAACIGKLAFDLAEGGVEHEGVPQELEAYAVWLQDNLDLWK